MGSSSFFPAGGEMCMEGRRPAGRRGAKKQAAAEHHKANRQPQRGLGVAQLEKIRLHNQMLAAYRSAGSSGLHPPATAAQPQAPPFAAAWYEDEKGLALMSSWSRADAARTHPMLNIRFDLKL